MNNAYWKWNKQIPKSVCQALIDEVNQDGYLSKAKVGTGSGGINEELRNNRTFFLKPNHWFEGILYNHIRYANESTGWNYNIQGCQSVQYTHYSIGEKYEWHRDHDMYELSQLMEYRKLTAVCQISAAEDFTGGGLYLKECGEESIISEQGDIVVFPSNLEHRAATVESGERITVVCWAYGNHFV